MSPTPGLAAALAGVSRRGAVSGATVAHAARPASPVPRSRPATAHASGVGAGQSGHGQWPARGWPSTLAGAARRSASPPLLVFRPEHAVGSHGSCQLGPWRWRHVHGRTRGSVATEEKGAGGDGARRPAGGARPSGEPPRLACSVGSARCGGAVGHGRVAGPWAAAARRCTGTRGAVCHPTSAGWVRLAVGTPVPLRHPRALPAGASTRTGSPRELQASRELIKGQSSRLPKKSIEKSP